jgi:hypothetical protein
MTGNKRSMLSKIKWLAPVLTLFVLGAMAAAPMFHGKPADADAYHARVKAMENSVPLQIGEWQGRDLAVPEPAVKMLRPNVLISRRYTNARTGRTFDLLLTQCTDGRDLAGHYPPNCYPGNGWTIANRVPTTWRVDDMTIDGIEYEFTKRGALLQGHIFAANFLILPDGSFVRDMSAFQRLAYDYHKHYYGAAQIQVVCDGDTLPDDRRAQVDTIVHACKPLIDTIRSGSKP